MSKQFVAKPVKVEAFQFGTDTQPLWFLAAIRKKQILIMPSKGHIVTKSDAGKINIYDPVTFNALFETVAQAQDLNGDGIIDEREKAIATEVAKKRKPRKKKVEDKPEE
ncbi:hypothetical protein NVP1152O_002 [Vibrio phage 1.152.O._10N.222.46.E1]|uniref:Uncharacterized protein n=5 Tax=Nahantvirus 49C7 TaxID=2846601 RepID=A0A2I7RB93_9CAUD|nr:hypothetical protein HYP57_gp002 [Vibrio phage 1.026.O._10N.222.49.C7]AUR82485.1 hypothetical protein NVP1025O_002 [Vibrio phage 1.025.O._10N.222.46.B6]AUR90735.1 hypothetical protein NVP1150O_002 [Vibrio phage 1.150.O._10N.222.46.A6]AUR90907.1 hypothetical protein NVP1152O_002 [Vibrio phage 1.152.O._10N.222.46.E1]AUS02376.1 hypothetical protein NVP2130O_002 [Vibrio phage 2.130.O._10N.222.46.C2]AUR82593.1 hypothetical protein NVP1026O_002 [Vibrio phage 1.026.O._10N.222.49.C7]